MELGRRFEFAPRVLRLNLQGRGGLCGYRLCQIYFKLVFLSFLAFDHITFSTPELYKLANNLLTSDDHHQLHFWVKTVVRQLLDLVSNPNYDWVSGFSLDSETHNVPEDFQLLPDWLKQPVDCDSHLVLPWIHLLSHEFNTGMPVDVFEILDNDDSLNKVQQIEDEEDFDTVDFLHI
ncbi:hypothetical protein AgCh_022037 [Apium graveolens]